MPSAIVVAIVEDDVSVRESLPDLLDEFGYVAVTFASAEEFPALDALSEAKCLILDIGLPGISGPDLQRELIRQGLSIPTIFITGRSDRTIPPGLLDQGGIACLFKPLNERELQAALALALTGN